MLRTQTYSTALPERITHRIVLGLAWPLMISMLSYTATSVVDTLFVGRLGTAQLAAVGLAIPLVHLFQSFGIGLIGGGRIAISHRVGANEPELARALFVQLIAFSVSMGVVIAALVPLANPAMGLLGAGPEMSSHAEMFFGIRILAAPLVFSSFAFNAWFHGNGDTRTPMVGTLLCNGVNIVLDPILIFGWGPVEGMGVAGAALATDVGFAVGLIWLVWRAREVWMPFSWRPVPRYMAEIWRLGSPIGFRYLLDVAAFVLFAGMLARMGEAELAAHVLVIRIISLSFLPGHAIGEAASVLVGHAVGGHRPELARQAWARGTGLALSIMTVMGLIFAFFPEWVVSPFSPSDEVAQVAIQLLWVAAGFQLFDAVAMVGLSVLNGAGDTRFAMWCSVLPSWLIKLPVGALLTVVWGWGAVGAWIGLLAEIVVVAFLVHWRIRGETWLEAAR